ncbi:MAG: PilZ domain-containing protein [Gemmataceae bacterium]|nr:PilZ domain-containing protein [Gemmataceae bacterium]
MPVDQYLNAAREGLGGNLPVAVGAAAAGVALAGLYVLSRRLRRPSPTPAGPVAAEDENALAWAPPEQSYADRRESVRRDGPPVHVVVAGSDFRNGLTGALVVDRSTGGLKLLLPAGVAPGTTLRVRAANAPDTVGYIPVIVRSSRPEEDHFVVGAEFEKTPPWNVLLLFG